MFYVYEWYVKETNEIFYVGKGSGQRYKVTYNRNKLFNEIIQKHNCDSRIIKYFQNEKDAFQYQAERIDELKNKDYVNVIFILAEQEAPLNIGQKN